MKTTFYTLAILVFQFLSFYSLAQQIPEERREEIEAQKVAFITRELALTSEEAQAFWPVYNSMEAELEENRQKNGALNRRFKREMGSMSDEEADALIRERFKLERERTAIHEKYYTEFKKVLSVKRVAAYYKAEKDFKRELLKMIRGGGEQRQRYR
jgi:hypothetical protein